MGAWIRIHIPNADPDPGGLKRAKKEGKTAFNRQIFRLKKKKNRLSGRYRYKIGKCYCTLFSLKVTCNFSI
jgi:hypothetical protein